MVVQGYGDTDPGLHTHPRTVQSCQKRLLLSVVPAFLLYEKGWTAISRGFTQTYN